MLQSGVGYPMQKDGRAQAFRQEGYGEADARGGRQCAKFNGKAREEGGGFVAYSVLLMRWLAMRGWSRC
jgi:hypothetical protein